MAFEQPDTDQWYEELLLPLLRRRGWIAVRIDRVEHNDNIDTRILAEIEKADLVVADLTYARPSVYFEAGYAARSIPVVYTCRADHLSPSADAPPHLRVHFDLTMKNIVRWRSASETGFSDRMGRRLDYVAKPVLSFKQEQMALRQEEADFVCMSLEGQLVAYAGAIQRAAKKAHFVIADANSLDHVESLMSPHATVGRKITGRTLRAIQCGVVDSLTKTAITRLWRLILHPAFDVASPRPQQLSLINDLVLLVTRNAVPLNRLKAALPQLSVVDATDRHLRATTALEIPPRRLPNFGYVYHAQYHQGFIGRTKSQPYEDVSLYRETDKTLYSRRKGLTVPVRKVSRTIDIVALEGGKSIRETEIRIEKVFGSVFAE